MVEMVAMVEMVVLVEMVALVEMSGWMTGRHRWMD